MAYCLTAPIHCRNQYLTYRQIQWHSSEPNSREISQPSVTTIAGKWPMENLFQISHGPIRQQTVRQTTKLPALQYAEKLIWIFTFRICVSRMSMHAYIYMYIYMYMCAFMNVHLYMYSYIPELCLEVRWSLMDSPTTASRRKSSVLFVVSLNRLLDI